MKVNYDRSAQIYATPPNPFPTAIPSGTTWKSGAIALDVFNQYLGAIVGYNGISAALKSTQAVTITIQRYFDAAMTIPVGAASVLVATANVAASISQTASIPAMFFDVQVANTSGTTAIITGVGIVLMPNI